MASPGYVRQVLWEAVHSLDSAAIEPSRRVALAAQALAKLRPDDFDEAAHRVRWSAILETLRGLDRNHPYGVIVDTVSRMSSDQIGAVEAEIRELADLVGPMLSDD